MRLNRILAVVVGCLSVAAASFPPQARAQSDPVIPPVNAAVAGESGEGEATETAPAPAGVDVVFCIDVSGSMAFQMGRMREAVRAIVREAVGVYPEGTPIRLGLVRYGNADHTYFVQHPVADHARFFRNLEATRTQDCGMEYFGAVVTLAADRVNWSADAGVEKYLFVVGNETAAQGPNQSSYRLTIPKAVAKGIRVSALYCPAPRDVTSARPSEARYSDAYREKNAVRRVIAQELDQKSTWVDAAALGQGRFLQLSWGTESPLLSWQPDEFRRALALVDSAEFEAGLAQERSAASYADRVNRMMVEAYARQFGRGVTRSSSGFAGGRVRR